MLLFSPLGAFLGRTISTRQKELLIATDSRIKRTTELLQGIKIIKYFNWERQLLKIIQAARSNELEKLIRYIKAVIYSRLTWWSGPILVSVFTFSTYTFIAGQQLDATTAFTSLALFNSLRHPLQAFPDILIKFIESHVSLKRIEAFLDSSELSKYENWFSYHKTPHSSAIVKSNITSTVDNDLLGFSNATLSWHSTESTSFQLENLNVKFPRRKLSIIAGTTGCGKTSLLLSLLGELHLRSGTIFFQESSFSKSVAYVAQTAWLQNMSIRDNITFGTKFDNIFYKKVLYACALEKDLKNMTNGDNTLVGVRGSNLSGGQKQRIALARAVYSRKEYYFLDDCLSAVDSPTARHLFEHCILDLLKGKTVLLITHAIQLCVPKSDYIIVLEQGKIAISGRTLTVLEKVKNYFALQTKDLNSEESQKPVLSKIHSSAHVITSRPTSGNFESPENISELEDVTTEALIDGEEDRAVGAVKFSVYVTYFKAAGGVVFFALLTLTMLLTQGSSILMQSLQSQTIFGSRYGLRLTYLSPFY